VNNADVKNQAKLLLFFEKCKKMRKKMPKICILSYKSDKKRAGRSVCCGSGVVPMSSGRGPVMVPWWSRSWQHLPPILLRY